MTLRHSWVVWIYNPLSQVCTYLLGLAIVLCVGQFYECFVKLHREAFLHYYSYYDSSCLPNYSNIYLSNLLFWVKQNFDRKCSRLIHNIICLEFTDVFVALKYSSKKIRQAKIFWSTLKFPLRRRTSWGGVVIIRSEVWVCGLQTLGWH